MAKEVVAITGGASGLGKGFVAKFVADGYTVVFCDLNDEKGQAIADEYGATFVKVDVTQANEVEAFFDRIKHDHNRLDVLINNAGVARGGHATGDTPIDEFQLTNNVNTCGVFYVAKYGVKLIGIALRNAEEQVRGRPLHPMIV